MLIRDVRVFDGAAVIDADTVLVRAGTVAAVGKGLAPPPGAEVGDAQGATLLRGLIDSHVQAMGPEDLEQALVFEVAAELDMFCVIANFATQKARASDDRRHLGRVLPP